MVRMKKRPYSVAVGILVILTVLLIIVSFWKNGNGEYIVRVNGYDVTEEEYLMLANEHCNEVYMQYTTEQVNREDFWTKKVQGTVPYKVLHEIILEELEKNYALKNLAAELGIVEDYTYDQLMEKKAAANEDTEYGLNEYSDSTYYKYWYSNLETQVRNALISEKIEISEKACKEYYDENQEEYLCETSVDIWYAVVPEEEEANVKAYQLSKAMSVFDSIEDLSAEEYFSDVEFEELNLNSIDTQEGMSGVYSTRWQVASSLQEGEVSIPYEENGTYCVIKCINKEENTAVAFESVSGQIERYLQVEEAKELIDSEIKNLNVKSNKSRIKEIIEDYYQ